MDRGTCVSGEWIMSVSIPPPMFSASLKVESSMFFEFSQYPTLGVSILTWLSRSRTSLLKGDEVLFMLEIRVPAYADTETKGKSHYYINTFL